MPKQPIDPEITHSMWRLSEALRLMAKLSHCATKAKQPECGFDAIFDILSHEAERIAYLADPQD